MISSTRKVRLARRHDRSRAIVRALDASGAGPAGRVPRISRLMALAIHFERLLREGQVRDQSELSRLAHVTQPRMTQIMNLNRLAPNIQEEILHFTCSTCGRGTPHEKGLRAIIRHWNWAHQRREWSRIRPASVPRQRR